MNKNINRVIKRYLRILLYSNILLKYKARLIRMPRILSLLSENGLKLKKESLN
jgi:hypothetical protein